MSMEPKASPASEAPSLDTIDPARVERAKDLLHYLANTVSAMKIFPSEHTTVRGFVDQLTQKFTGFLAAYQKLQVGIEEFTFTYGGKPVYVDEVAIKSLPFFFFKDGLQALFFYQGLERAEILEFLEMIAAEAQKPAEDSDIVVALWERDFPNIQYYAPDEFLENRILAETRDSRALQDLADLPDGLSQETIEVRVDTAKFSQGRVDLDARDREAVEQAAAQSDPAGPGASAEDPEAGPAGPDTAASVGESLISPAASMDPTLTEDELQALEAMVRANRTISPEEEYIDLMVEIIYLEENAASCQASLDALLAYHFDQLQRGSFHVAVLIIQKVHDLGRNLGHDPAKAALLDGFLRRTVSPKTVEAVKTLLDKKKALDWESLLGFFWLVGPSSLGLAADLFDIAPDGEAKHKIIDFIEKTGEANPGLLAGLADNARPDLARQIIGILARIRDSRGIPHLAPFVNFQNKEIKSEAIRVLGRSGDPMAGRILAGFLNDPDEEVRIQAVLVLDPAQGGARVQQILREASGREFQAKSLKEKEALLAYLGRTRSAEALEFLSGTLLKSGLFASKKRLEARLAAVAGLESMATDEAVQALQKGVLGRTKKVREACEAALVRLPPSGGPRA